MTLTPVQTELTKEQLQQAVEVIISKFEPVTLAQSDALTAFRQGDYKEVKRLAMLHPLDQYCKALSFLGGAFNPQNMASGNSFTILNESTMKMAELAKEQTALAIAAELQEIFHLAGVFS